MGIGAGMIKTQGEVVVLIHNTPIHFQIVSDDFPLKCDGLLGISFLGHVISSAGVKPDPGKVSAVKQFPIPLVGHQKFKIPSNS